MLGERFTFDCPYATIGNGPDGLQGSVTPSISHHADEGSTAGVGCARPPIPSHRDGTAREHRSAAGFSLTHLSVGLGAGDESQAVPRDAPTRPLRPAPRDRLPPGLTALPVRPAPPLARRPGTTLRGPPRSPPPTSEQWSARGPYRWGRRRRLRGAASGTAWY